MKRVRWALVCCGVIAGVLAGASIANAEEETSEPPAAEVEGAPRVEVGPASGWTLTGEGEVVYEEGEGETASRLVGCVANFICIYSGTEYSNPYGAIECSFGGTVGLSGNRFSATNRCGNKTDWLRVNGTATACMNPSGDRPHPGAFNEVFVAVQYGAFC